MTSFHAYRSDAPAWMSAEQAAAWAAGVAHAERTSASVVPTMAGAPGCDPNYRPQVRPASTPSAPYRPTGRNPMAPWWERYAGLVCTCPPGCTQRTWGDGGTCVRACVPCAEMHGQTYQAKPKTKKKPATTTNEATAA